MKNIKTFAKKNIFNYNSNLSFGAEANHVSVYYNSSFIYFYIGTASAPILKCIYHFTEEVKLEIEKLESNFESADYIKGEYIIPAYWGVNL